ncbi:anthrone oxygenase family protein [Chitinophaga sp. 22536]|uniref:anthrone oxygenase family protein n=1 Tax=unclassified Chitinophaga TaxID=2619133 RepID=UPI003F86528C
MNAKQIVLILAVLTTGLLTGIFFGFEVAINPAFARLDDAQYIIAMQAINDVIVNPVFIFVFLGAAVLLPVAAFQQQGRRKSLLWVAAALYIIGVLAITSVCNVPLNDALAKVQVAGASAQQLKTAREGFAEPWNRWHTIRTIAGIVATIIAIAACLQKDAGKKGA